MTVHMVRLYCEPPKGEAETAVNNWVSNHNEWENDPVKHELIETNTEIDGTGIDYLAGDYRFIQEGEGVGIVDTLSSRLQSVQGGLWHRLGYHKCGHDGSSATPCTWEQTVEYGTVPTEIPTIEVTQ